MNYDGLIVAAVAAELRRSLAGARVQGVRQHNATDLTIELRSPGQTHRLFCSADAEFPRFYLSAVSEAVPETPPGFCMLLRKHLVGTRLAEISQVRMDRIVIFKFVRSQSEPLRLVLEIMGKHSNVILIDHQDKILGAAKHIGSSVSRARQILPGRDYSLPPGADKIDIASLQQQQFHALWQARSHHQELCDWLVKTFSGFGPFLAAEIGARVASEAEESVWHELSLLGEVVRSELYSPVFITNEHGQDLLVYPVCSAQFPDIQQHPRRSINEALDAFFRSAVARRRLDEARGTLLTSIGRAIASRRQALKSIQRTLAESENAERYRQIGELILSNKHLVGKGDTSVVLTNYFDDDLREIEIELDAKLSAQQNAERYFRRYRKARDSSLSAEQRRTKALADLERLEAAAEEAKSASSVEAVSAIRHKLLSEGYLRETTPAEPQPLFDGHRIRRVVTENGWEILYGESAQANDYLTQKIARPNDVWLHARAVVGAHVVVRASGRKENVPAGVLMEAASIAARNSQARHSSLVPVDYTLRKHVRKPRGSAPGFVTYSCERTIDVTSRG